MAELSPASAGDAVARLLAAAGPILSLDIGSGTQDVLLALPANGPKIGPVSSCPPPRSASPTASAATQPPVAPSGCTGTTWAAVSPSPFRNRRQPARPRRFA